MFSQFFGNYLLKKGEITKDQFTSCMEYMRANRVKLGLIAEAEGLLTRSQANELNQLQMQTDKRFGDLAIENGYLTDADVSYLLKLQGSPYLIFIQALDENRIMDLETIHQLVAEFQRDNGLSHTALEAIKCGDFDRLLPSFVTTEKDAYFSLMSLALRNIVRFVSPYIRIETAEKTTGYSARYIAYQKTTGACEGFLGFASNDSAILTIADGYAGEYFERPDEDALDSVGEFTNCINGLHATELSYQDTAIDMLPPEFLFDSGISDTDGFYILPLYITGKRVDMIIKC